MIRNRMTDLLTTKERLTPAPHRNESQTIPDHFDNLPAAEKQDILIRNFVDRAEVRVEHLLQFECLSCNSVVAKEFVVGFDPTPLHATPSRRTFRAYCEHCNILHEVECVQLEGIWKEVSFTSIRDPKQLSKHFASIRTRLAMHAHRKAC